MLAKDIINSLSYSKFVLADKDAKLLFLAMRRVFLLSIKATNGNYNSEKKITKIHGFELAGAMENTPKIALDEDNIKRIHIVADNEVLRRPEDENFGYEDLLGNNVDELFKENMERVLFSTFNF